MGITIVAWLCLAGTISSIQGIQLQDTAEIPQWEIGDSWVYQMEMDGGIDGRLELDEVEFDQLSFTVTDILPDDYKLSLTGDLAGDVEVELDLGTISGSLQDTQLSGTVFIDKNTLSLQQISSLSLEGAVKPYRLPKISFELQGSLDFSYESSVLDFPIDLGENWTVPEAVITLDATVTVAGQNIPIEELMIFIEKHEAETDDWEDVTIGGINYHALKIDSEIGADHELWYCPGVGNIVKIEGESIPLSWGGHGYYDMTMELMSTTFPDPPNKPAMPSGETSIQAGETGTYITSATDPANNNVRYIFDWDDGSDLSTSDFVSSGEQVSMNHKWNTQGSYSLRVQAQNVYGAVSDWSDSLTVSVLNDPPQKPDKPSGPTEGKAMETYTYTTSSSDPNDHNIRYGWDWDGDQRVDQWTDYYSSGETATASHVWNDEGSYSIRVKAEDEHGGESDWSDPLSVTMPKTRLMGSLFFEFLKHHPVLFRLVQRIW